MCSTTLASKPLGTRMLGTQFLGTQVPGIVCLMIGLSAWGGCQDDSGVLDASEKDLKAAGTNNHTTMVASDQDQQQGDMRDQSGDQVDAVSRAEIDWDAPVEQPPEAKGMKRASPDVDVWFDTEAKRIVMGGRVCQDNGALEFFATLRGYQEHEAIVTIKTKSSFVHALLLSMGVNPGHPVQYRPEFKAAEGPEINVMVHWTDAEGKRQVARAQDWVKHFETGKPLEHPFIFGGSTFIPMQNGQEYYAADDGYLICVANFPSAMLDLPITSTDSNAGLLFEANDEKIPPIGTEVAVVLEPKDAAKDDNTANDDSASDGDAAKGRGGDDKDADDGSDNAAQGDGGNADDGGLQ